MIRIKCQVGLLWPDWILFSEGLLPENLDICKHHVYPFDKTLMENVFFFCFFLIRSTMTAS